MASAQDARVDRLFAALLTSGSVVLLDRLFGPWGGFTYTAVIFAAFVVYGIYVFGVHRGAQAKPSTAQKGAE